MTAPPHARNPLVRRVSSWPRRVRMGFAAAASLALAAGLALAWPTAPDQPVTVHHLPDSPTVEAQLHHQLAADGEADFWVYLRAEPQLDPAAGISDWAAQGHFVHDELTRTAARSQEGLLTLLDAAGVDYDAYWIANTVRVTGDRQLLEQILTLPEVAQVTADREYQIQPATPAEAVPARDGIEWNVQDIEAPRVWDEFATTGEGIVVGVIDTGAQFDHPALVEQYRGNLGNGRFDHNYHWHDPSQVCADPVPCDNMGHGTHVTGTIVGDDGGDNRIGVAPGAQWIAAKGCEAQNCSKAALLSAGQFMLAPTDLAGENPDPARRPHVVNNSWGGDPTTDPWYQPMVQAWIAAGIFPQFSSGNTLIGIAPCGSASNPGNLPETYTAGAYDSNGNIAAFSNRGPSAWGSDMVKPNIAAPGVAIRSADIGNNYSTRDGTSMASPHVAGVVALMWSAAEALQRDIDTTRELLDMTAIDTEDLTCGGEPGNNNVWGQGRLNAYSAVSESPRSATGTLHGVVTDTVSDEPIVGAKVSITGPTQRHRTTGPDGEFSLILPVGEYEVTVSAFGYEVTTVTEVVITEQQNTDTRVALPRLPRAEVAGTVVDINDSAPLADAQVGIYLDGALVGRAETDANGDYTVNLPLGTYQLDVDLTYYQPESATVTLDTEDEVVRADFALRTPLVTVSPHQLDPVLPAGAQQTYTIGIDNRGSADAAVQVRLPQRPWASIDATNAVLRPGGSLQVTLAFDTSWMEPGTYPLTLSVTSNSGRQPVVELPIQLRVPELDGIDVTPDFVRLRPGQTQQHQAIARLGDGTSLDVTAWAEWRSSDERVVTVDQTGLATTVGGQRATVTAALGGQVGEAGYHVTGRPIEPPGRPRPDPQPPMPGLDWQPTFFGPGLDGYTAYASVVWDDGNGPALYVGGDFRTAGEHRVNHVARWDGQQWQPLAGAHGTGVNGAVTALAVYDGKLIVGGRFTEAGGMPAMRIAQWDGTEWSTLTGALGAPGADGEITDLLEWGGDLLVAGAFTEAGGVTANRIARWDGTEWSALTSPDGQVGVDGYTVTSLTTFDGDLIAAGLFTTAGGVTVDNVARWDGQQWHPLAGPDGFGVNSIVHAAAEYDGQVIVGGEFQQAGGVTVERIAAWDGSRWHEMDHGAGGFRYASVNTLTVHDGDLLVGGNFPQAGRAPATNIARWDGTGWSPLGDGTGGTVFTITPYDGRLYVAGGFADAGGQMVNRIATWDGETWAPLPGAPAGLDGQVTATTMFRGELVVAGQFYYAGSGAVQNIARWDGQQWHPLAGPILPGLLGQIDALLVHDDQLIAAGNLFQAGGVNVDRIAVWDGEQWAPMGDGLNGRVAALAVYDGEVVAAGEFTHSGQVPVDHIARWDGQQWHPLGGPGSTGLAGVNPRVEALLVHDGHLIAGGQFDRAGGVPVGNLAQWDGQQWSPLDDGTGVNGLVHDMVVQDGDLVVGGRFTEAGGVAVDHVARWDGTEWSALAGGPDGWVTTLAVLNGTLVVGGDFTTAGGQTVNHIASWDGQRWWPLTGPVDVGTDAPVSTLATYPDSGTRPGPGDRVGGGRPQPGVVPGLLVGGQFTSAGGMAGWGLAWYGLPDQPW